VALLIGGMVAVVLAPGQSDLMRVHFWSVALHGLTWLGNGVGSFNVVHVLYRGSVVRAGNVHNDFIQLIFEFGLVGLVPIGILVAGLRRVNATDWAVLVAFAVLGLVYFPLWSAVPAFIGCAVAGHLLRRDDPAGRVLGGGRPGVMAWGADQRRGFNVVGGRDISPIERPAVAGELTSLSIKGKAS
jgi:hypothetical protein